MTVEATQQSPTPEPVAVAQESAATDPARRPANEREAAQYADHDLESVRCPLCASDAFEPRFEKHGLSVVRCRGCRLLYVNPRLKLEALGKLYNSQVISNTQYYLRTLELDARAFAKRLELIERHCEERRLLDIGCGPGTFLKVAAQRGWKGRGIEVNATSVASCRSQGVEALCGTFPHPELAGERFDAIVLNDVIEHLVDPRQALQSIHTMLRPNGVLFLSTPDAGALVARWSGASWVHLKPIEHLLYFERRSLNNLLRETGFEVLVLRSMGRPRSLALVFDRLRTYSALASRVMSSVIRTSWAERVALPINPGDEMAVLARKR